MGYFPKSRRFFATCGRQGGQARARSLAPARRSAIAAQAANARWKGSRKTSGPMPSLRLNRPRWGDPVYVGEVLEEESLLHWREIYRRIADRPFGPTAEALEKVLASNPTYGVTLLWRGILRTVQGAFS